jgi:hypothetical protein
MNCGYDRRRGSRIPTEVAGRTVRNHTTEQNLIEVREGTVEEPPPLSGMELGDEDAARAERVVRDADWIIALMLFSPCLPISIPLLVAWSLFRLYCWYRLNYRHPILRTPNSLSPYCELAMKFQACRIRLWIGALVWPVVIALYVIGWAPLSFR